MDDKTLVLEGLPGDLDLVRTKLELYFKNKRKSGGEVMHIRAHPEDKRKALLTYLQETDLNNVLKQGTHKIDFKAQGVVELTVKPLNVKKQKVKPPLLPRPKIETLEQVRSSQATAGGQTSGSKAQKGNEEHSKTKDLLISTMESVDKDILTLYFEQFTEKAEIKKYGKNKWILKVANQSDLLTILGQKKHEFGLKVELCNEACVSEQWDPLRFILTGFKDSCKCKLITMFIGSCSQKAAHTWEIVDDERIVVTFKEDIDSKSFIEKCAAKNLNGMEIEATHLEFTDSVLVQGDMSKLTEEALTFYFENNKKSGGGDIKSLIWVNKQKSVVISFQDCHVAQEVVMQKHHLCGTDLSTSLFYSSLQKALTGEMPVWSNISTNMIIPVDKAVRSFIEKNKKCKNDFESQLRVVHANVIFDKTTSPGEIALEMAMDKESLAAVRLGATWESKAQREAQTLLSSYSTAELPVEVETWKRVERDCLEFVNSDVEVTYMETKIAIVGLKTEVTTVLDKIQNLLKDATAELEVERNTVEKVIRFESKETLELVEKRVHAKLQNVTLKKNETNLTFRLQGLRDCVSTAERVIKQAQENVIFQQLNISAHLLQFLKSLDLKKFEQNHFVTRHIPALFQNDGVVLGIVAEKEYIKAAEDKVKKILQEEVIHLTPDASTVTNSENWVNFLNQIKVDLSHDSQNVNIIPSEAQILICGFAQVVANLSKKVKDYLENKTPATEYIHLKSFQELGFVDSCLKLSEIPEIRKLGITIRCCRTMNSPCLKVTTSKEKLQDVVTVVKRHISSIFTEKKTYSKAGESKVILKHEANIQAKAKEWCCKAYISTHKTGPSRRYSHQVNSSITLTVTEGDLQHFPADALICPMSSKLAFDNPVAQRFLQVAGSDIQAVCSRLQKEKQTLLAGEVVLSDPGNLNANSLIYTVLPQSGQQFTLESHYLKSAILNSLQKAESRNDTSIAMSAIGCETFGFSTKESCMAIREAVLQFSNDQQNSPKSIKNIFVVDSDVKILEEFNNIIAQLGFSNTKASVTPTNTTTQDQPKSLNLKQASDTEVIVHGVVVSLKKGDITNETVDVIVNSNNKALDLDTGVSGAILRAAGKSVVKECKNHGHQKQNGVVLTSGGKLSCKHIAQMVGPNNAADITTSVEKVLKLCETTMAATVAIPAIGTGRGGIGANDSIKAILAGVENHLTQSTSSSLQKITVLVIDQKVLDAYCNYFKERNSKTAPTSTPANKVKIAGVWIEIKKGNITNESVRCIVNTTNDRMNLTVGVSGAIFRAAGPSVQQECHKHGPLQGDTAAVTSGGNLQCDFIIHMKGPHSIAEAKLRVKKVLERCEEMQISTISFPAVGTGGGGINNVDAITGMLQGFHDHLSQRSSTAIKLIYVVIDRDEVLKDFQQGLNQWTANSQQNIDYAEIYEDEDDEYYYGSEDSLSSEEEDDFSGNSFEANIGTIKVKVFCGDITKETTDAIVSSTNTSLNLSSGVSGAILKAAGKTVVDECTKLGVQPGDGVVLTTAGKLPVKHIVHMVGQTKEKEITNCMYKVLKKCEENKIQSVSFPALGTGAGNLAAAQVANAMMDALANISIDSPVFLKTVHIVIFQSTMLSDFEDAMKKFKRISRKPSAVTVPNPTQQTSDSSKSKLCLATETAAVTFPVTNVEVYGTSSTDIAKVIKLLDDLVSEECTSMDVQSSHLANFPEADNKAIVELSQNNQVHVLVAAADKLIVSGKKDDVLDTVLNINKFLQAARDREFREGEERRLSKTLRWEVAEEETWLPLNSSISYELELAFHKKDEKFSYQENGETFTVDFKEMKRVNTKGKTCKVKRSLFADSDTAIIQPPPTWTKMDGSDLEIVVLSPNSEEYKKLENDFLRSSQHDDIAPVQVVQIRRIQSQPQWQRYFVLKQAVDKKYPKQKNEQILYHGTTKDICQKINRNGFNRSFCGRNAVAHGDGTYFAKEAWYSCYDQYSNPDENGLKYIYRARVVTGSPCKSRKGMKEPDPLNPKDPRAGLHDCAVDDLQNPFIFVVFCDAGAYPDYLISFKNA
ncbi:protein mono-ADP-ribosyltransferase PARP14 isoform X1 [Pangasianodon hypophthalmus]|uniref:protein mono-ADP-ribosyltransferase PARP14 isoform X1 n=1 Tax=Pangasianodon hypophthalmus TaxID=310915 RepID=UPI000F00EA81|nr:protein mono-ADP-ribosyltransferase PARP14 isoform X1 [Pangasianodon hypophthalmus]